MKTIFILLFLSIISQSCITPKAKYTDKGTVNNNSAIFSINGAKLSNKKSVIGITTQIISAGVGGYLGYKYFPVALGYTDGKLNASSMGGAVLGGIAGYGINNSFNYLRGEKRQFQLNQNNYNTWKKSFDPNNKFIAINNNYSNLEFVDKGYESKFSIKNFEDAQYFKKAFPNSQYSQKVFEDAVKTLNRTYLPSLSKLYTNVNQESLYKSHLLSASNFNEYKESVELFPFNKVSGENLLSKTVKTYNDINSFNTLYPNSKYTGEIAKALIPNVSLSDLNTFLKTYKKHFSIDAMPNYDKIEQKGYLLEWILAFNDDKKTDPLKTKYLNYSENLADFSKYSSTFKKNYLNTEWQKFNLNRNLANGEVLYNKVSQIGGQFNNKMLSNFKDEIVNSTLESVTNNFKSLSSQSLENLMESIKSNLWLQKNAPNAILITNAQLVLRKAIVAVKEFNNSFLEAIKNEDETLVKKLLAEGAETDELNYDQFYFIAKISPSKENSEILYKKLTKYEQYASFLRLYPSYTEEFERKIAEWKLKKCGLYVSETTQTTYPTVFSYSKNNAVVYDLVVPQEKLDEYKTYELMIHKINETKAKNIFDMSGAVNGYNYWVITRRDNFNIQHRREEEENGFSLRSEKDFDNFIEKILDSYSFRSTYGCKNEIEFKDKLHDHLSGDQKEARIRQNELRKKREGEYAERQRERDKEDEAKKEKKEKDKEFRNFQDFKDDISFTDMGKADDNGVIFRDFTGSCPCYQYKLTKENYWINDNYKVYKDTKGKWFVLRDSWTKDSGPFSTSDDLLKFIYETYHKK